MLRFVAIAVVLALLVLMLIKIFRDTGSQKIDWNGIAAAGGFIVLAFYLRHVTGIG